MEVLDISQKAAKLIKSDLFGFSRKRGSHLFSLGISLFLYLRNKVRGRKSRVGKRGKGKTREKMARGGGGEKKVE